MMRVISFTLFFIAILAAPLAQSQRLDGKPLTPAKPVSTWTSPGEIPASIRSTRPVPFKPRPEPLPQTPVKPKAAPVVDQWCRDLKGIGQIQDMVSCQTSSSYAACAGLATAISGRLALSGINAANLASAQDAVRAMLPEFDRMRPQMRLKVRAQMEEYFKTGAHYKAGRDGFILLDGQRVPLGPNALANARLEGRPISVVVDEVTDALLNEMRKDISSGNIDVIKLRGGPSGYFEFLGDRLLRSGNRSVVNAVRNLPFSNFANKAFREAMPETGASFAKAVSRVGQLEASVVMRAIPKKLPLFAGGFVGALLFVVGEGLDATPTGCSTRGWYPKEINEFGACDAVYRVDQTVVNFLNATAAEQKMELTENQQSCAYYKKLHEQLYEQPKFVGLTCGGPSSRRVTLTTRDSKGGEMIHDILYAPNYHVSQINVRPLRGHQPENFNRWSRAVTFDQNGVADMKSPGVANTVMATRTYVPDAVACCAATGLEHERCMTLYNSGGSSSGATGSSGGAVR